MTLKIQYKGRSLTERDIENLNQCFGEKIDDMRLCEAVILRVMQSPNAIARGAMSRVLDTGRIGTGEGGRVVRQIIRRTRRDLGYKYTWGERLRRFGAALTSRRLRQALMQVLRDVQGFLLAILR